MKQTFMIGLTLLSLTLMATSAHSQCGTVGGECLINGNLDTGTAGGSGLPGDAPPWTLANTGNATAAQFQGGFADNTGVRGLWYRAFLGNATTPVSSTLSQGVVVPAGGKYVLTFDAVIEQNFTADSLIATLSSSSGPIATLDLLAKKIGAGSSYTGGGFGTIGAAIPAYDINQMLLISGVSASDTLTVSVAMTNGIAGAANPQSTVVDNFSLTRVPEPSSLLLAGLSLVGMLGARRRG